MNSYYNVLPTLFSLSLSSPFPPYIYVFIFTWGGGGGRQLDAGNITKGCDALGALGERVYPRYWGNFLPTSHCLAGERC